MESGATQPPKVPPRHCCPCFFCLFFFFVYSTFSFCSCVSLKTLFIVICTLHPPILLINTNYFGSRNARTVKALTLFCLEIASVAQHFGKWCHWHLCYCVRVASALSRISRRLCLTFTMILWQTKFHHVFCEACPSTSTAMSIVPCVNCFRFLFPWYYSYNIILLF